MRAEVRVEAPAAVVEQAADWRCVKALWLFLLVVYLLTMAGRLTSGDGEAMYLTTKSLLTEGRLSIQPRPETAPGRRGQSYSKYGIGQSVAQAPFFVLGQTIGKLTAAVDDRPARFAVGMTNSVVSATLVALFWLLTRDLGCARGGATVAALVFGLATLAWPYARADFSEPLQAALLLLALYSLRRWRRGGGPHWAAAAGAAAGFAVLTKVASIILLPPLGLYFAMTLWQHVASQRREASEHEPGAHTTLRSLLAVPAALLPLGVCGALQLALNLHRFGSVTEFGYGNEPAVGFTTPLVVGVWNLLLSSGKGLFLYAPPVLLGLAFLPRLARREPLVATVILLVFLAELLYYARWWAWHGDWCWGPRYLVVTVPFIMLGWAPLFSRQSPAPAALLALASCLASAGLLVSSLGVAIDYGTYYSVVGSQIGRGVDVKEARLVPEFSPLLGHAWLAQASVYDALGGLAVPAANGRRAERDRADNPYLEAYPWRSSYPQLRPEAPERALGFDVWFAALEQPSPFVSYWSTLGASWLGLTSVWLGSRLWRAARAPAGSEAPQVRRAARPRQTLPSRAPV